MVLHVIPEEDFEKHREEITNVSEFFDSLFSQEEESASWYAERVVEQSFDDGDQGRFTTMGRVGDPANKVLAVTADLSPRHLLIGGKRRSPTEKALFGSTTHAILLNAEVPVVEME